MKQFSHISHRLSLIISQLSIVNCQLSIIILSLLALAGCRDDQDVIPETVPAAETILLNVDVVLPADIRAQWMHAIYMAQDNIAKAQQKMSRKVEFNLQFHDEDTEDLDQLGYKLTHPEEGDDTCHAIIGPYHSSNAMELLKYAAQTRLPVLMPTCSSAELQRINDRNTYAWFLTESDITQCEIMLSVAQSLHATDVTLIHSDDTYGQSFKDWFAYYATERNIHIAGGTHEWKPGDDLRPFLWKVVEEAKDEKTWVLLALSNAEDYLTVCKEIDDFWFNDILFSEDENQKMVYLRNICADTSMDQALLDFEDAITFDLGVTPSGSLNYGFPQAYEALHLRQPFNGEAQIYDAFSILALGAAARAANPDRCIVGGKQVEYFEKPYEPGLTDYMRSVVSSEEGITTKWDANGLATAFRELSQGRSIYMTGATGTLNFDEETYTKILNTTYMIWQIYSEQPEESEEVYRRVIPLLYLSTEGSSNEASTTEFWKLEKRWNQEFNHDAVNLDLPKVTDHWAVVISPSTTWNNYRHQADAFAIYQTLRNHGYDDDHIVLIVEDNLADDPKNVYPGEIFVDRTDNPNNTDMFVNDNVRSNATVDYHFSELQPEDLADIMMGRQSERLPHVIKPTATSNVFFFWSGHGGSSEGPLWGNEDSKDYFGKFRIHEIVSEMAGKDNAQSRKYRRMMMAVETCFSGQWGEAIDGQWGEALVGQPDVIVLTAANSNETSKADVFDQKLGVYLSNAFTRTFRRLINTNPSISFYDLYRQLARTTNGSHVTLYNEKQYGSVYTETMQEFFPE
jgi:glycosylphosphatidylinositol transamidase (GPIT) subunit GPI8/ABC-type branched-subunit amino acid transport system substrate-binding protein